MKRLFKDLVDSGEVSAEAQLVGKLREKGPF